MNNPAKNDKLHTLALQRAKAPWGTGWSQLTDDVREALLAREALFMLMGQCDTMKQFDAAKALVRKAMAWGAER